MIRCKMLHKVNVIHEIAKTNMVQMIEKVKKIVCKYLNNLELFESIYK